MTSFPITMVVAALAGSASLVQAQGSPSSVGLPVIPPQASLELLADVGARTEGPAPTSNGAVYFVDLDTKVGGRIWQWDPATGRARVVREPSGAAVGLAIERDGVLLTAELAGGGGRRVGRLDVSTGTASVVVDSFEGKPIHGANDLALDEAGRIFFTEYVYLAATDVLYRQGSGVYRVDPDGKVERIIADAGTPNGVAVSPDQRTLYVGSNRFDAIGNKAILAYDLNTSGQVRFRSVLVRLPPEQLPDGMAIDVDGNLYVAINTGRFGVAVYDPTGAEIGFVATPGAATNVAFGLGGEDHTLYITAANGLYRLRVNRQGYNPSWAR